MKPAIVTFAVLLAAACASGPPKPEPPLPDPPQIAPGLYLAMKGTEKQMKDIPAMSSAMLFAGKYCEQKSQTPELVVGAEGDVHYLAFRCVPGEAWPPKR